MGKFIKTIDHKDRKIDLRHLIMVSEMRPTELHHKIDGSLDNKPYGQFSLETLKECLNELGYDIIKK